MSRAGAPAPRRRAIGLRRAGTALRRQLGRPARWWTGLEPPERVFYRAAVTLGIGWGLVWPPMVLIIPGTLWALVFFGFSMRRST
jgi:hypothetical protein